MSAPDGSSPDGSVADSSHLDSSQTDSAPGMPDASALPDVAAVPDASADGAVSPSARCAPLAAPTGRVVRVTPAQANMLPAIVAAATTGTTILLEDGMYRSSSAGEAARRIQFTTAGVTMRSASNNASAVIIDAEYMTNEAITVHASDVVLAHFTIMRAVDHPIHVTPPAGSSGIRSVRLYGLRVIDGGEQFVKVNSNGADAWVDDGRLECSTLAMTDAGRTHVERNPGGCYTGGIDAHGARGWIVRDNRFESIYCAGEGLAEHAVHFWVGSRDTLVENNTIVDCARGVGFGLVQSGSARTYADNPYPGVSFIGHYDGIIRNNVIAASIRYFDTGIELDQARGARVYHNTVYAAASATGFFSPIDYRFANTVVDVRNNLVSRAVTRRDGAMGMVANNGEMAAAALFVDPATNDFHLRSTATAAIDRGVVVAESGRDIDGVAHDRGAPDLGADELQP